LLIAADGARSAVRELLGLRTERHDYAQQAIVAEIATERPHQRTARQRFLPGGPVAMLPLANGNCSLVWSCPEAEAADLLALGNEEFAERLTNASDNVLGRLECVSERLSFPLASNRALRYIDRRCALLGDAAHQVHPLAGQGLNLGLLDAASLAAELTAHMQLRGADPGDRRVLRRFERARKGDNVLTQRVLSGLNDVFRSDLAPAAARGMSLLDSAGSLKRLLAGYAMGDLRAASAASRISH
jgi:ubiquinone biosynthesis UbiH/UbiF/VisC/COQ6 family hydroxylase